jgi:RNA polymerase sigma-70 factor (ECF subfamily)
MTRSEACRELESLYPAWHAALAGYARRALGCPSTAEDLVQEVFLRLYAELRTGKPISNTKGWTLCVLRHEIGRCLRQRRRELAFGEPIGPPPAAGSPEPEEGLERLLGSLTQREEEVVLLRLASLKYREIAGRLDISVSSVNTLLARAIAKLQRETARRGAERISHEAVPKPGALD